MITLTALLTALAPFVAQVAHSTIKKFMDSKEQESKPESSTEDSTTPQPEVSEGKPSWFKYIAYACVGYIVWAVIVSCLDAFFGIVLFLPIPLSVIITVLAGVLGINVNTDNWKF